MSPRTRTLLSWLVHFYTSLGLVAGLLALEACVSGRVQVAFWYLLAALVIDSTDGMMARGVRVTEGTPCFDGRKLDDLTDYLNYVFLPVFFAYRLELVPRALAPVLALPLLASAYGFCSTAAKTEDGYFTGFPSYWNVFVVYAYLLRWPGEWIALLLALLSALVFVPTRYVYPTKTVPLRPLTMGLTIAWLFAMLVLLLGDLDHPSPGLLYASLTYPAYYCGLSFYLHFTRDQPD